MDIKNTRRIFVSQSAQSQNIKKHTKQNKMKKVLFIRTADADENGAGGVVLTPAEKIANHQATIKTLGTSMATLEVGSKEWLDANLEIYKINQLIKAEQAGLLKIAHEQEIAEKRNARIVLADNLVSAAVHHTKIHATKSSTADDKTAADDALAAASEVVKNELLAKFAVSTPSKSVATGTTAVAGGKGATTLAIRAAFDANRASGMSDSANIKAIIDSGFSRGTTGAVVLAYQKELGEKS